MRSGMVAALNARSIRVLDYPRRRRLLHRTRLVALLPTRPRLVFDPGAVLFHWLYAISIIPESPYLLIDRSNSRSSAIDSPDRELDVCTVRLSERFQRAIEDYLHRCFEESAAVRVDELAQAMKLHPSTVTRAYRALTGYHLSVVLKERQVAEAQRLLVETSLSTSEIAKRAGFGTPNTLFRVFRTRVGVSPERFRRERARTRCRILP